MVNLQAVGFLEMSSSGLIFPTFCSMFPLSCISIHQNFSAITQFDGSLFSSHTFHPSNVNSETCLNNDSIP